MNENEHVLCGLFYHFGPKSAIRAPKIVPKRAVLCAREIIRGPVEPFCWAPRVGRTGARPPRAKKSPEKARQEFLARTKPPQASPEASPSPAGSRNQRKRAHRRNKFVCWCPRCAWGVASGYIKSQNHLEATVTSPNEQKRAKYVRNCPKFLV